MKLINKTLMRNKLQRFQWLGFPELIGKWLAIIKIKFKNDQLDSNRNFYCHSILNLIGLLVRLWFQRLKWKAAKWASIQKWIDRNTFFNLILIEVASCCAIVKTIDYLLWLHLEIDFLWREHRWHLTDTSTQQIQIN